MESNNKHKKLLKSLEGKTIQEAQKICDENNFSMCIIREDSKNYAIYMDFRFDRVNVEIDNGIVTSCDIG